MPEDLTPRDVFQQLDARLGRVEDDVRAVRGEMHTGFQCLRGEIHALRDELNLRFDRLTAMFTSLLIGLGALAVGVAGIWLKL